jgi:hypothetical protein
MVPSGGSLEETFGYETCSILDLAPQLRLMKVGFNDTTCNL